MKRRPKILIVENAREVTGSTVSALRVATALRHEFEFSFILPKASIATAFVTQHNFVVQEMPMLELRRGIQSIIRYPFVLWRNTVRLNAYIKAHEIDLIVNNDFYNLLPGCVNIFFSQIAYVCFVRFLPNRFPPFLVRLWVSIHEKFAYKIVAVSEAVKSQLPVSAKLVVVHNEIPDVDVVNSPVPHKLMLYPSNYIPGKGQDLALESFSMISRLYPDWKLRFVGGDMGLAKNKTFKRSLIQRAHELGCAGNVEWLDFSNNLAAHYQQASFVLNFSESESFSLTTLDAQFYGRAVVATRCGGPEEIIDDGVTGVLVPLGDKGAMVKAVEQLITQPKVREEMGARGFEHVRQKFSYAKTIEKLASIYRSAIEK